jgi:uncharacterized membrane protein YdbT with pleckstrin-like domain
MAKRAFKDQYDDEEVLLMFRKHPVVMRRGLIYFMFAILLGTIPSFIKPELPYFYGGLGAGFVLGIIVMFPSWIYWYFSVNIMTDQRFIQIVQKGFFKKRYSDIGIEQIQSINYEVVGVQETLLGFGTIIIQTYLGDIIINDVHKPQETTKELSLILRDHGSTKTSEDDAMKISHERTRQ